MNTCTVVVLRAAQGASKIPSMSRFLLLLQTKDSIRGVARKLGGLGRSVQLMKMEKFILVVNSDLQNTVQMTSPADSLLQEGLVS